MGMDGNDQRNTRRILGDTGGGWRDIYRLVILSQHAPHTLLYHFLLIRTRTEPVMGVPP